MLKRNIHIFYYLRLVSDKLDKLVVNHFRLEVQKSYPLEIKLFELSYKLRKMRFSVKVNAVTSDVLSYQYKLLNTVVAEYFRLG